MLMNLSSRALKPFSKQEPLIKRHAKSTIGGVIVIALLVWFGIWAWPEVHRTIRMHRM